MNENENKVTERNVQAEHSNASANNAMVDDSAAAAAAYYFWFYKGLRIAK